MSAHTIKIILAAVLCFIVLPTHALLPQTAKQDLKTIYEEVRPNQAGKNADYIPALAEVDRNDFAIAVMDVDGHEIAIGDVNVAFPLESVVKPFAYALALMDYGLAYITAKVGVNATGRPFNSLRAIEDSPNHLQNPLVNAGAIQIASLIKGENSKIKWERMLSLLQSMSDGRLYLGEKVFASEMATNKRNRAIAQLLDAYGLMYGDSDDAVMRYTKACSVMATVHQLVVMGATLANDGVHPVSHARILSADAVRAVMSQMIINGLYENSGAWFMAVGIPAKSGVSGVILAVVPHHMAIVVYSPPIDSAGNSVRAQEVIKLLSQKWKLHLLNPMDEVSR